MAEAVTKNVQKVWWQAANVPWELHCDPFKLAPRMYYIGNTWVGAFLIDTGDGLAVIDTTVFESAFDVVNNIYLLGYNPKDIKNIFLTHCHADHIGSSNQLKSMSGADIWLSKEDTEFFESRANKELSAKFHPVPLHVDKFYDHSKPIVLGDVTIRTVLTPGHTPGTTTFFIDVPDENGKILTVGLHGGVGPNTMKPEYLEKYDLDRTLRQQFIDGCEELKKYHVDISIPSHPQHGDLMNRRGEDPNDYSPLVDETEWARFLQIRKEFAESLNK